LVPILLAEQRRLGVVLVVVVALLTIIAAAMISVACACITALIAGLGMTTTTASRPRLISAKALNNPLSAARAALAKMAPYWRWYGLSKLYFDPLYAGLAAEPSRLGRTLDIGCGPGLSAAICAARADVDRYLGIDLDRSKLAAARWMLAACGEELGGRFRLVEATFPLTEPIAERFDTILLFDVLHYWNSDEQRRLLTHLREAAAHGGRMLLRDGIAAEGGDAGMVERGERFTTFFGLNRGGGSLSFLSERRMRELLTDCGWEVASSEMCGAENRWWSCTAVERTATRSSSVVVSTESS